MVVTKESDLYLYLTVYGILYTVAKTSKILKSVKCLLTILNKRDIL